MHMHTSGNAPSTGTPAHLVETFTTPAGSSTSKATSGGGQRRCACIWIRSRCPFVTVCCSACTGLCMSWGWVRYSGRPDPSPAHRRVTHKLATSPLAVRCVVSAAFLSGQSDHQLRRPFPNRLPNLLSSTWLMGRLTKVLEPINALCVKQGRQNSVIPIAGNPRIRKHGGADTDGCGHILTDVDTVAAG